MTPVTAPKTPASLQRRNDPGGGASWYRHDNRAAHVRLEHRKLTLEPQHGGRHQSPLRQHAGIGHHEPGAEIIGAVANDVVTPDISSALSALSRRLFVSSFTSGLIAKAAPPPTALSPCRSATSYARSGVAGWTVRPHRRRRCRLFRRPPPRDTAATATQDRRADTRTRAAFSFAWPTPPTSASRMCRE